MLIRYADDPKLARLGNTINGKIQNNLDRLEKWSEFNIYKSNVLHLGNNNQIHRERI